MTSEIWMNPTDGSEWRGGSIVVDGRRVFNPTHEMLESAGYALKESRHEDVVARSAEDIEREYRLEVERIIAERYTTGQEIQFAREQDGAGEKYAEYLAYVADCKERAKRSLAERASETDPVHIPDEFD